MSRLAIVVVLGLVSGPTLATAAGPLRLTPYTVQTGFDQELADFEAALVGWQAELDATDGRKKKRALKKTHPAKKFAEAMRARFTRGEMRAGAWCLEYLTELGLKRKDREGLRLQLYDELLAATDSKLRRSTLQRLLVDSSMRRAVGLAGLEQRVALFMRHEPDAEERGEALFLIGKKLGKSRDALEKERASKILKKLLGGGDVEGEEPRVTLSETSRAQLKKLIFAIEHLSVGAVAPDFTGKSVDGESIALKDTRGKVTVLSFFGFW